MEATGNVIKIEIGLHGDKRVINSFQKVGKSGKKTGRQLDKSFDSAGRSIGSFNNRISNLTGLMGGLSLAYMATQVINIADSWTLVEGRLKLVTDSSEQLSAVQEDIFNLSQDTRTSFTATADLYTRLARSTSQLNKSDAELLQVTRAINQSMLVSGATAQEANAAIIQLGQGMASGALRGEELRSVLEQTPRLAQAIAEGLGVSIGQLRELGSQGKLTTEVVFQALIDQSQKIETEYKQMPVTVGQAVTELNNSLGRFISKQDDALSATERLAGGIEGLAAGMDFLSQPIDAPGEATWFGAFATWVDSMVLMPLPQDNYGDYIENVQNLMDVLSGRRDFNTGQEMPLIEQLSAADKELQHAIAGWGAGSAYAIELRKQVDQLRQALAHPGQQSDTTTEINERMKQQVEADKKLLTDRLKEYEKFYKDLDKQVKDHAKKERQSILDLNNLYRQQMDLRRGTEGMLAELGGGPQREDREQYTLSRTEIDQQYQSAMMLGGQDQIDALERYKKAVSDLAQEFRDGFDGTEGSEITTQAINDIQAAYGVQQQVMADLTESSEKQVEANRIWGEELKGTIGQFDELKGTIVALDFQMAEMDKVMEIAAEDRASSVIRDIRGEIDRLHDKTVTITTVHRDVRAGGGGDGDGSSAGEVQGSYAIGTQWVPKTGLYQLHQGEEVLKASEGRSGRSGGGGFTIQGDLNISFPDTPALQNEQDVDLFVRDQLIPKLEALGK